MEAVCLGRRREPMSQSTALGPTLKVLVSSEALDAAVLPIMSVALTMRGLKFQGVGTQVVSACLRSGVPPECRPGLHSLTQSRLGPKNE